MPGIYRLDFRLDPGRQFGKFVLLNELCVLQIWPVAVHLQICLLITRMFMFLLICLDSTKAAFGYDLLLVGVLSIYSIYCQIIRSIVLLGLVVNV